MSDRPPMSIGAELWLDAVPDVKATEVTEATWLVRFGEPGVQRFRVFAPVEVQRQVAQAWLDALPIPLVPVEPTEMVELRDLRPGDVIVNGDKRYPVDVVRPGVFDTIVAKDSDGNEVARAHPTHAVRVLLPRPPVDECPDEVDPPDEDVEPQGEGLAPGLVEAAS